MKKYHPLEKVVLLKRDANFADSVLVSTILIVDEALLFLGERLWCAPVVISERAMR
jgi:hypothetical protein